MNEAYLKLTRDPSGLASKSYEEVIATFANAMRQILVDAARRKSAQKRVPAGQPLSPHLSVEEALALDRALGELEHENQLQFHIGQCRFLLGMTVDEAAATLSLSKRTIEREWQSVRALLKEKLQASKV